MKTIQIQIEDQIFIFDQSPVSIGKNMSSHIFLDDPKVSKLHARLVFKKDTREENDWTIEDFSSLNGTFVNQKRIKKGLLRRGDVIQIAHFRLRIDFPQKNLSEKEKVSETLKKNLEDSNIFFLPENILRERLSKKLENLIEKNNVSFKNPDERQSYISRHLKSILGLGFLEDYLSDPDITEIMINGPHDIYVEKRGVLEKTPDQFPDVAVLFNTIDRILAPLGRRVDEASPLVDARLPDGSRIHVALPPVSLNGPLLTIRKFLASFETLADLISAG